MDGLDVALCEVRGSGLNTKLVLEKFKTVSYTPDVKERISEVFAKPVVDFQKLAILHTWIGMLHGKIVLKCLQQWRIKPETVDVVASHGQTVMHSPAFLHPEEKINATFQAGDGDQVAAITGIITVSDFRQKHIAHGGEGAPLAVYGDYLLLSHQKENRILLNIGGIANFTYLPAGKNAAQVFVTDTGPGNTLIDQTVRHYFPGVYYDHDAQYAAQGLVHQKLLSQLKADAFFKLKFPKTTGPELFNMQYVQQAINKSGARKISPYDLLATLTRFSAETIAEAIKRATRSTHFEIYLSGGGAHNPLLVGWLNELLKLKETRTTSSLGVHGDAKEAILFAVLANETISGGSIDFGTRAKIPSTTMGKISFPD